MAKATARVGQTRQRKFLATRTIAGWRRPLKRNWRQPMSPIATGWHGRTPTCTRRCQTLHSLAGRPISRAFDRIVGVAALHLRFSDVIPFNEVTLLSLIDYGQPELLKSSAITRR